MRVARSTTFRAVRDVAHDISRGKGFGGACPACDGLGTKLYFDPDLVVLKGAWP
jgi:excinuclease UvrABC ATPase subunit